MYLDSFKNLRTFLTVYDPKDFKTKDLLKDLFFVFLLSITLFTEIHLCSYNTFIISENVWPVAEILGVRLEYTHDRIQHTQPPPPFFFLHFIHSTVLCPISATLLLLGYIVLMIALDLSNAKLL